MTSQDNIKDEWFPTKNHAIILNKEQSKEFREWEKNRQPMSEEQKTFLKN